MFKKSSLLFLQWLARLTDLPIFDDSLRKYLFSRIMGVTLLMFALVLATATLLYDRLITRQSLDTAAGIAGQAYAAIETLMPYGPSREELLAAIGRMKAAHATSPYRIEVHRSALVEEHYGNIDAVPQNDTIREVLAGGASMATMENGTWTRHFYPLVAEPACLHQCHANATAGAVLGVVEVKQNIKAMATRLRAEYLWLFVLYGGLAIALVVVVTMLVVNRVTRAVEGFRRKTAEIHSVIELSALGSDLGKNNFSFTELNQAFAAVGGLAERLRDVAVDKDILEFEINILNKFIITSDVVRDWQKFVKELLVDINSILDTYALFAFFQEDENKYELDVFWRSNPAETTKVQFENIIRQQIYSRLQLASDSPEVRIIHHDCGSSVPLPRNLDPQDIELRTKSLFLETPRVGGIVGIGLQANMVVDSIYHIVLDSVLATLLNLVGSVKAISKYTKDLEYYATRDPLTHLHNQRMFWELLGYEIGRAERHNQNFALLVIDLDNFKTVNDRHGHPFGDLFLQQMAATFRGAVRDGDFVARYGGDEFTVLLPETSREQAHTVATRIIESVAALAVMTPDSIKVQGTISIGLAMYPAHGQNARDLFMVADNMMYKVKGEGKNAVATPEQDDVAEIFKYQSEIDFKVSQALENRNIFPHFQPIVQLDNGRIWAHEMLMRIPADGDSVIMAGEFIKTAERIGLLPKLDQIMMEKAYHIINDSNYAGNLFINLTPKSLIIKEFIASILAMTKKYDINPNRIIFEVTERDTVRNVSMLQKFVSRIKADGFRFAVDDFGSGYSSFKYLKLFPIDFIKIEGEFIRNMLDDADFLAYTKSIVTLAKELKVKTVAEYVEDERIFEAVKLLGIDYGQGYHIGRPAPEFMVSQTVPRDLKK